jgi:hypothetical protein
MSDDGAGMEMTTLQTTHEDRTVPDGAPAWVTPSLLADTMSTWQCVLGKERVTADEAVFLLITFTQVLDLIQDGQQKDDLS